MARVKECVRDVIARSYDNRDTAAGRASRAICSSTEGEGQCTVWVDGRSAGLLDVVFANAAGAGAMDVHAPSCSHPGCVVVPAAFGVGESLDANGAAVVEAIMWGYEAMAQIGTLAATASFIDKGYRPTGLFGPFGAAAATTRLLSGDESQLVNALALAGSQGGGLCQWAEAGTRDGPFQSANAARGGVQAALVAAQGINAPTDFLEGRYGFLQAYSGGIPEGTETWPSTGQSAVDDIYFKAHPCCAFTQETLEAGIQLHRRGVKPDDVVAVAIHTYRLGKAYPGCDYAGPFKTPEHGLFSNQAVLAAGILAGEEWRAQLARHDDPTFCALAAKTQISVDPEAEARFPETRCTSVEVELADGTVLHEHIEARSEDHSVLSSAHFVERVGAIIGGERAARLSDAVDHLETLTSIRLLPWALGVTA
jgi:2-methylcitrate dehydratase PrpD